ncbi:hypothetical protein MUP32_02215 [Candidatus Microgenomates bacterium]|nr:hypothetical protein [Candidatus Microgenomates bacterium]
MHYFLKIKLNHTINIILLTVLVLSSFPNHVFADGMVIHRPDPYSNRWDYSSENNQQAFINYENGIEKLIISIDVDKPKTSEMLWLFPIPSNPEKVVVDIIKNLPKFSGEEISGKAKTQLSGIRNFLLSTQIYTLPYVMLYGRSGGYGTKLSMNMPVAGGFGSIQESAEQDVVVYDHVEKEGMITEIITAKTSRGLYDYFKSKDLDIDKGTIPVLDQYIGKDFSFVASWIKPIIPSEQEIENKIPELFNYPIRFPKFGTILSKLNSDFPDFEEISNNNSTMSSKLINKKRLEYLQNNSIAKKGLVNIIQLNPELITPMKEEFPIEVTIPPSRMFNIPEDNRTADSQQNQRGIFVTFPSSKIFYPLIPTSVYGTKTIPMTIRNIGHVSPEIYADIKNHTNVKYYLGYNQDLGEGLDKFYKGKGLELKYTKIDLLAPSKLLTQDLWINQHAPLKLYYSSFIGNHPNFIKIILLILASSLSGVIVSVVLFPDSRSLRKLPRYFALGLFNALSLIGLMIAIVFYNTKQIIPYEQIMQLKQKGYFERRRMALILFIICSPFAILSLYPISVALATYFYGLYFRYYPSQLFFVILIIFLLLIFAFHLKKIKPEDKYLFDQLNTQKISSWTFQPKDSRKLAFIPLYSLTFIVISLLLIKIIENTV